MKFSPWVVSTLSSLALCSVVVARPLTVVEKQADIQQLTSLIRSQYAPLELKQKTLGINLDKMVTDYSKESENLSNGDFYYLLNRFVAAFQDGHFKTSIKTDHKSTLGFVTDLIEGKIVIETIDRSLLPDFLYPLKRGDQILSVDGVDALEVAKGLEKYVGAGNPESRKRLASFMVASRATAVVPPKTGESTVKLFSQAANAVVEITLPWIETGTPLETVEKEWSGEGEAKIADYQMMSLDDNFADYPKMESGYMCNSLTRFAVPAKAVILMRAPFLAYTFDTARGKIGYLRIPHFNWGKDAATRLKQYEYAISKLEATTEGLVVDATHNCGGAHSTMEEMLKMFALKPFTGLKFSFLGSRTEMQSVSQMISLQDASTTLEAEGLTSILAAVKVAWKKGNRLSEPVSWSEGRQLHPASIRYTKPLVVLTDELSGSGGDAFPAVIQGMGRGLVIGKTTMGAGGIVIAAPTLNNSGNVVKITKSLFFHPNGRAIEGAGVTPDKTYEPTLADYTSGYAGYQKFYLATLFEKIDEAKGIKPATLPTAPAGPLNLAALVGSAAAALR